MSYEWKIKKMWLLGGIAREAFLSEARYYGPGDYVHAQYQVRPGHEIYNADIGILVNPGAWLTSINR